MNREYGGDYLEAVQDFDLIAETKLRDTLQEFYDNPRSRDQAWKTCKGSLYEYAVFKSIQQAVIKDEGLNRRFTVMEGDKASDRHRSQVTIRNWSEIFPDVDILIVEKDGNSVKAIMSCKTSLRERLTETAFWKRELEKSESTKDIRLVFITTDKDNELRIDTNRYILLHVVDCTFVTDPQKYNELVESYKNRYGDREDFSKLLSKIKKITEISDFLRSLS